MQALSITSLHIEIAISVCGLLSAVFCVFSKNSKESVMWFILTSFFVFTILNLMNAFIVGIISIISSVSIASVFLLLSHNIKSYEKSTNKLYMCIFIVIMGCIFSIKHFISKVSNIGEVQYYSGVMSILTILLLTVFISTICVGKWKQL
jgi:NADH:ubiquinone oxidoreductase subunit 6 (subunit J)